MDVLTVDIAYAILSFGARSSVRHVHQTWSIGYWKVPYYYDLFVRCIGRHGSNTPAFLTTALREQFQQTPAILLACARLNLLQPEHIRQSSLAALNAKDLHHLLIAACASGNTVLLARLREAVPLGGELLRESNNLALRMVCENGHATALRQLHAAARFSRDDVASCRWYSLRRAARNGHREVVEALVQEFNLSKNDFLDGEDNALQAVCTGGHTELFGFLCTSLSLNIDDVVCGLEGAVRNAHLPLLETMWHMGVTEHMKDSRLCAVRAAVSSRSVEMLKFLHQTVGYTKERFEERHVLSEACAHSGVDVVRYLHEEVGVSVASFAASRGCKLAAANGEIGVVEFFISAGVDGEAFGSYSIRMAEANSNWGIARLLRSTYGLALTSVSSEDEFMVTLEY